MAFGRRGVGPRGRERDQGDEEEQGADEGEDVDGRGGVGGFDGGEFRAAVLVPDVCCSWLGYWGCWESGVGGFVLVGVCEAHAVRACGSDHYLLCLQVVSP